MQPRTQLEIEAGLAEVRRSPADEGRIELIVARPDLGLREVLEQGQLDLELGLVGDSWSRRASKSTPDGSPHPGKQLTLMNARMIALLAGGRGGWAEAGDQIFVDLDLRLDNLPAGTCLALGDALIEVSAAPHTGCDKFVRRFGAEAQRFVASDEGRALRARGMNARVVRAGTFRVGDLLRRA